jgi:hypothetical protein
MELVSEDVKELVMREGRACFPGLTLFKYVREGLHLPQYQTSASSSHVY